MRLDAGNMQGTPLLIPENTTIPLTYVPVFLIGQEVRETPSITHGARGGHDHDFLGIPIKRRHHCNQVVPEKGLQVHPEIAKQGRQIFWDEIARVFATFAAIGACVKGAVFDFQHVFSLCV
jgi:hypothetical protein